MYIITVTGYRFISACFNETIPNVVFTYSNPPNLSFRANGHTKVKVQFSSWPQITRWSVHKYIHNVTKVMCALYVRCALSVLQKECRKVWGARYTLGARYLFFKRNVENFGVRVVGREIRYLFWVCACSLRYASRSAHAPYYHLWPAPALQYFFPHFLINGTIFKKRKRVTE